MVEYIDRNYVVPYDKNVRSRRTTPKKRDPDFPRRPNSTKPTQFSDGLVQEVRMRALPRTFPSETRRGSCFLLRSSGLSLTLLTFVCVTVPEDSQSVQRGAEGEATAGAAGSAAGAGPAAAGEAAAQEVNILLSAARGH